MYTVNLTNWNQTTRLYNASMIMLGEPDRPRIPDDADLINYKWAYIYDENYWQIIYPSIEIASWIDCSTSG